MDDFSQKIDEGLDALKAEAEETVADDSDDSDGAEKQSQASALVAFVNEYVDLAHDKNADVYAQDKKTKEVRRIESRSFRDWLVASYYSANEKSPRDQSVREALATLAGLGRFKGECVDVFVRVALVDEAYYLDLCVAGNSRVVRIQPGRWEVVHDSGVKFIRPETMRPLPDPVHGGDLSKLWALVNIPENARLLVVAWLIECLRPDTPFPVLEFIGEQGSAKSTTQAILRRLIDPNACDLRAAPKVVEDIFVTAGVNWLVSYENISHLSAPMQDALCVLATGGGFAKRKLYSDADESVIVVKRPVVINGISVAITAQDLIDRAISVETPVINDRQEVGNVWRAFEAHHAEILGGLLDVMAKALELLPGISLPARDRPRLTEFACLGIAVTRAMKHDMDDMHDFMQEFSAARQEAIARTIDSSPVAGALIEWFDARERREIEISPKQLLVDLDRYKPVGTDSWPKSGKGLGDVLRRAAPALRQLGIEVKSLGKRGSTVPWLISSRGKFTDPSRPSRASRDDDQNSTTWTTCTTSPKEFSTADTCPRCAGEGCSHCKQSRAAP